LGARLGFHSPFITFFTIASLRSRLTPSSSRTFVEASFQKVAVCLRWKDSTESQRNIIWRSG
jgi:hypothetical protein